MTAPPLTRLDGPARCALLACLLGLSVAACALPGDDEIAAEAQPIVGGQVDLDDPAVAYLVGYDGGGYIHLCTGTLVAETVVLTAAHCLPIDEVYFGTRTNEFVASRSVTDEYAARNWQGIDNWVQGGDIALLRLDSAAPADIDPVPINTEPLDDSYVGKAMRVVGFGMTGPVDEDSTGTKRFVNLDVKGVTNEHVSYGDEFVNHCEGDSGGPNFMDFDGTERIVGVVAYGDCVSNSWSTRPDVYYPILLEEVIDAWSGPCQSDGNCVTEGCRTPDPDCDICGFDGYCGTGCEKKDLDCPVSGFQGDPCNNREDCETLLCLESPEDPRVKYCSTECDPDNTASSWSCRTPLSECVPDGDGTSYCRFSGITPGVQGSECTAGDECRSSICYPSGDVSICAETCGGGEPECPEPYSCEDVGAASLCILPTDGGGCCQTSGAESGRTTAGTLLLAGLTFVLFAGGWRRRRRAPAPK